MNTILQATLKIIGARHRHPMSVTVFEDFCRLVYKSIHCGQNPAASNELGIDEKAISSSEILMTVKQLKDFYDALPAACKTGNSAPVVHNTPVIIINYKGIRRLLDGTNRINFWAQHLPATQQCLVYEHVIT